MTKTYDLEDRTAGFAKEIRLFVKALPKTIANIEDIKQLVRSSGSVGASYIETNDSLSKKDFLMRIKICRRKPRSPDIGSNCSIKGKIPNPLKIVTGCIRKPLN